MFEPLCSYYLLNTIKKSLELSGYYEPYTTPWAEYLNEQYLNEVPELRSSTFGHLERLIRQTGTRI